MDPIHRTIKLRKTTWLSLSKGVDQGKGIEEDKIRYMEEQKDEHIMTPKQNYTSAIPFPTNIEMEPIGKIISPIKRDTVHQTIRTSVQAISVPVEATIALFPDKVPSIALKDMEGFDRIWVIWLHLNDRGIPPFYLREVPE